MSENTELKKLKMWAAKQAKNHYDKEVYEFAQGNTGIQEKHCLMREAYESVVERVRSLENDEVQDSDE